MSPPNPLSERLRFSEFVLDRLPNGRCRARVGLTWKESEQFAGENEGLGSQAVRAARRRSEKTFDITLPRLSEERCPGR